MASVNVRKRSDKWEYYFEIARIDGKRKRVTKGGFLLKKDALSAGTSALNEYNNVGQIQSDTNISVSDYLDIWIKDYCNINLKDTSIKNYEKIIRLYIKPKLGMYKLSAITSATLQDFINSFYRQGISKNTLLNIKGILSNSFRYAVTTLKILKFSPVDCVNIPKTERLQNNTSCRIYIPKDKMDEIFKRFPEGTSAHIPLLLGYKCGMRLGEAFAVTWNDVNLEDKTITINRQLQWSPNRQKWYLTLPKYKSIRTIDISTEIIELLNRTMNKQVKAKEYYGDLYTQLKIDENNFIGDIGENISFINIRENGDFIQPRIMQHASMIIHSQLKYTEFVFHSLRHTHCTMLLENGVSLKYVQTRLGHKNIQVTLDIYNHLTENQTRIDKEKLEKL